MLLLVILFCISPIWAVDLDHFHVCTIANSWGGRMDALMESCRKHHIDIDILGIGRPYPHNGVKLLYMLEYLDGFSDEEIVLFLDAFDTLVIAEKAHILETFLKMNSPFVMAAEKQCTLYDAGLCSLFPTGLTPFRYINTGTYIGYVGAIRRWIEALQPIDPAVCDQLQTLRHYVKDPANRTFFTLDTRCELFLPLYWVEAREVLVFPSSRTFWCITTKTSPCILHANGRSFFLYDRAYRQIVHPKEEPSS